MLPVAGGLSWVMGGFICGLPGLCLDGGQFMSFVGGHACFVWWVVMVHGLLGWTSHVVSGSAVVIHGWSHSPRIMVGDGCGWVCSSSFVDFDRGEVVVVRGWSCPFHGVVGDRHWWVVGAMRLSHMWFQNP